MGANDYLTKPWRNGELLARIRSAIRVSTSEDVESVVEAGKLEINLTERTVKKDGEYVKLTTTEYNLLACS
jgi:two-component system KDP operon response regulator KdpE